jgi:pimeloyl-ACP methyl ester carboxylesterase
MATIVLATALLARRHVISGRVQFRVWRTLSPEAHGGHYATINGVRIYYETYGRGSPVLVLHGGLGSIEDMGCQIRPLASTRLVVAPDSRAHGRSSDSDEPLSYRLMADDMVKLLDVLKLGRVDVVGWSDGGIIGLDLAIHHPERVGRLVVIGANYDTDGLKQLPPSGAEIPPRPGLYARTAPDPTRWSVLYRKVITMWRTEPHYSPAELHRIRASTLVMAGEFDVVQLEHTNQLARAVPNAQEAIIQGGTHFLLCQKADVLNSHILKFLQRAAL